MQGYATTRSLQRRSGVTHRWHRSKSLGGFTSLNSMRLDAGRLLKFIQSVSGLCRYSSMFLRNTMHYTNRIRKKDLSFQYSTTYDIINEYKWPAGDQPLPLMRHSCCQLQREEWILAEETAFWLLQKNWRLKKSNNFSTQNHWIKMPEGLSKIDPSSSFGARWNSSTLGTWLVGWVWFLKFRKWKDGNKSHLEMISYWRLLTMSYSCCYPNLQVVSHWLYQYGREQMGKMNSLFVPPSWAGNETQQRSLVKQPFCRIKIKSKEIRKGKGRRRDAEILFAAARSHTSSMKSIYMIQHPYGI